VDGLGDDLSVILEEVADLFEVVKSVGEGTAFAGEVEVV